jgi:hypothetical protein
MRAASSARVSPCFAVMSAQSAGSSDGASCSVAAATPCARYQSSTSPTMSEVTGVVTPSLTVRVQNVGWLWRRNGGDPVLCGWRWCGRLTPLRPRRDQGIAS